MSTVPEEPRPPTEEQQKPDASELPEERRDKFLLDDPSSLRIDGKPPTPFRPKR